MGVRRECTNLARAPLDLGQTDRDESVHQRLRKWTIDGEVQRALGHGVPIEFVGKLREHRAAEREVAQVILERGKASDEAARVFLAAYAPAR